MPPSRPHSLTEPTQDWLEIQAQVSKALCKLFFKALVRRPMISQACLDRAQASFILSRKFLL